MTPQGLPPALTFFVTVFVAMSTTETSFDGPLAEYKVLPSGESAIPHGRAPTSTEFTILLVAGSIVNTCLPRPVLTNRFDPSGAISTAMGLTAPGLPSEMGLVIAYLTASTTSTAPSFSAFT